MTLVDTYTHTEREIDRQTYGHTHEHTHTHIFLLILTFRIHWGKYQVHQDFSWTVSAVLIYSAIPVQHWSITQEVLVNWLQSFDSFNFTMDHAYYAIAISQTPFSTDFDICCLEQWLGKQHNSLLCFFMACVSLCVSACLCKLPRFEDLALEDYVGGWNLKNSRIELI